MSDTSRIINHSLKNAQQELNLRASKRFGQSTIEFTFAMVVIALLIFGLIKVFRWVGMDYAQKAYMQQHDVVIDSTGHFAAEGRRQRLDAATRNF